MNKGSLVIISGFSGAGKGTIVKRMMSDYDNYALSISATTRAPREGEVHGREYFFISTEQFEKRIEAGQFLEYARYVNNYYGTPLDYVTEQLESGRDMILEIEMQGALKVKERFPDTILVFVTPPDAQTLRKRLEGRGTETQEQIEARLKRAAEECVYMDLYDYILVNDDLDEAVAKVHQLIQSSHMRTVANKELITLIRSEVSSFKAE